MSIYLYEYKYTYMYIYIYHMVFILKKQLEPRKSSLLFNYHLNHLNNLLLQQLAATRWHGAGEVADAPDLRLGQKTFVPDDLPAGPPGGWWKSNDLHSGYDS
jgi:hypothetical protein